WERSDDGLSYTFTIKQGVMFHNGEELKASDVAYSIQRGIDSPYAGAIFGPVEGAEALSDYEVRVDLKYEYSPFLSAMSAPLASIVSEKAVEEHGDDFSRNPVGTGAYKIVSWEPGDRVTLEAFDDWHLGEVPIKNLVFRVLEDPATSVIALEKGEIDLLLDVPTSDRKSIEDNDNLELYEIPSHRFHYVGFNTEVGLFSDVKVRQAVAYALDRESIRQTATEGISILAQNHIAETILGFAEDVEWYEQDMDKALELIEEAGVEEGASVKIIARDGVGNKMAQVLQDNLLKINIQSDIEILEDAALTDKGKKGDFDIIINPWSTPVADADYTVNFLFHSKMIDAMNLTRYNEQSMDDMIIEAEMKAELDERGAIYKDITQQLKDDVPSIPIFFEMATLAANKDLKNVEASPSSTYYFYDLEW
ncbi:MAG: ABC transporter substrate-binding protein, partial [Tissierellia bacterium]|nr:ABC transporter substrate-binding protein [Tissierellia bacterium]